MYESLNNFYFQTAETDSKIYPPPALPIERNVYAGTQRGFPEIPQVIINDKKCSFLPITNDFASYSGSVPYISRESYKPQRTPLTDASKTVQRHTPLVDVRASASSSSSPTQPPLLPVLDPVFNLREICKQSILLEDHLTHDEKRCTDCCIKHFLALEGLCEEAITLDKEKKHLEKIERLPKYVREVARKWYENPSKNALECAQMLRKMRKDFQENSFDVIFNKSCGANSCSIRSSRESRQPE